MEIDFNKNWTVTGKTFDKRTVDLPYDAMLHEKRQADCPNGINSGYFPGGAYIYEKDFILTEADIEKKIFIHFEGVYRNCRIICNGEEAAEHRYGYSCFDVDISEMSLIGKNHISVYVDNSLEPNCRWYSGSGIYRDVTLIIKDSDYIDSCRIETLSADPAVIKVEAKTVFGSPVRVEVYDGGMLIASSGTGELNLGDVNLWSSESPYLYRVRVFSDKDELNIRYGIRRLEWSPKKGLTVNGESVLLRGGCIHHDHGILGASEYYDAEYRRISILKENGFNAIRTAHNQASKILLDICDELGMYVMDEAYDGWYIPKTYHDYSRDFNNHWREDIRSMVASAYNHPSVIMYSIGNEVSETASDKGIETCGIMADYTRSLDQTRPVTAGINVLLNVYTKMGMGVYKEKGEYREAPLNRKKYKEKKTGSAFFNMMAQKLGGLMFFMSKGRKGDNACKGAAEKLDIIGLNYASSRYDEDAVKYPSRMMVGSETMAADLAYNWERVKKYPQLIGDFVWSAWDYLGEACIGDWTYPSYKGLPLLAGQGMIDITGKPLAAMAYMRAVWGLQDKPYIAVSPLNHSGETPRKDSWQFTNAVDSYSWNGYEGKPVRAEIYGSGDSVSLYLNGKLLGTKRYKDFQARFEFSYEPGTLEAVSLNGSGEITAKHFLCSAGDKTVLTVTADRDILTEGKLAYVTIEFTDETGNLKPFMEEEISVEVTGPAVLLGLGSGLCKTDEIYTDSTHRTYRGRALAVLKGTGGDGKICITCRSACVDDTTIEIEGK